MNKVCAVYRDGSKSSQPLMNQLVDSVELDEEEEEERGSRRWLKRRLA